VAIYHLSAKPPIRRADGRCATAAAAYRAGCVIVDERTGIRHDYRRRHGVVSVRLCVPGGAELTDRGAFWNSLERHHRRKDAVVAREVVVGLPAELVEADRTRLANTFAAAISARYGIAVDCAIHLPSGRGDDRNHHAHLLLSACHVDGAGALGSKALLLDPIHCRRARVGDSVSWLRPEWERMVNDALAEMGSRARIDHRSHAIRGIPRRPTTHVGIGPGARQRRYRNEIHRQRNIECEQIDQSIRRLRALKKKLLRQEVEIDAQRAWRAGKRLPAVDGPPSPVKPSSRSAQRSFKVRP
jgi:hypothetical protein